MKKIFLSAIILRIILAAFLYHTDLKAIYRDSRLIEPGIVAGYQQGISSNTALVYPPPIYLLYYYHQKIDFWLFSDHYTEWMKDWGSFHVSGHPHIFRDLLVMKLPLLIADLLTGWILLMIVPATKKRLTAYLWFFNPFTLYAIYGFGNLDIIPTLLVISSIASAKFHRWTWSYIFLGVAAGFKLFPLLLLPFWFLIDPRSFKQKLPGAFLSVAITAFCFGPLLFQPILLQSLFISNLTSGIFNATIQLGSGSELPLYLVVYGLLFFAVLHKKIQLSLETILLVVIGSLFALSHFHPQWIIWITPALVLLLVEGKIGYLETLGMMISYLILSWMINDKFVAFGQLKALNEAFDTIEAPRWFLDRLHLGAQIQSLATAAFFVSIVWIILQSVEKVTPHKIKNIHLSLGKIALMWTVGIILFFVAAHAPLPALGKYIDQEVAEQRDTIDLMSTTTVSQQMTVHHPNFNGLALLMKNVNLANHQNVYFTLFDDKKNPVRNFTINGGSIGDDFNLKLNFPPIADSQGKTYTLQITSPTTGEKEIIKLPYNGAADIPGLTVSVAGVQQPIKGHLAYTTYYNPGGLLANVQYTLYQILTRF